MTCSSSRRVPLAALASGIQARAVALVDAPVVVGTAIVRDRRLLAPVPGLDQLARQHLSVDRRPRAIAFASRARAKGRPVLTGTVRSDDDQARAARYADQIIFEA